MLFDDFLLIRGANLGTGWIVLQWNVCVLGHFYLLKLLEHSRWSKEERSIDHLLWNPWKTISPPGLVSSMSCKGLEACPGPVPASPWWVLGKAPAPTTTLTGCTWVGLLLLQSALEPRMSMCTCSICTVVHLLFVIVCMFDNTPAVCIPTAVLLHACRPVCFGKCGSCFEPAGPSAVLMTS